MRRRLRPIEWRPAAFCRRTHPQAGGRSGEESGGPEDRAEVVRRPVTDGACDWGRRRGGHERQGTAGRCPDGRAASHSAGERACRSARPCAVIVGLGATSRSQQLPLLQENCLHESCGRTGGYRGVVARRSRGERSRRRCETKKHDEGRRGLLSKPPAPPHAR